MTPVKTAPIITAIRGYLAQYLVLPSPDYSLALTLWALATHCWPSFDSFPYVTITSATKRSGKSLLAELLANVVANGKQFGAIAQSFYRIIREQSPVIFIDEAEELSYEGASKERSMLAMGYRRGQTVPRFGPKGMEEWPVYCPKVFILIGDIMDILRDRSIVVTMMRATAPNRYMFSVAQQEGHALRDDASEYIELNRGRITDAYLNHKGLPFLTGRDEELWIPLFSVCEVIAPELLTELQRVAVDMSTEKTAEARQFITLKGAEVDAQHDEYADMLLRDVRKLLTGRDFILTTDALHELKEIATSPWRKFRGEGLTAIDMANLLSRFGVSPKQKKIGGRKGRVQRGYSRDAVSKAMREHFNDKGSDG